MRCSCHSMHITRPLTSRKRGIWISRSNHCFRICHRVTDRPSPLATSTVTVSTMCSSAGAEVCRGSSSCSRKTVRSSNQRWGSRGRRTSRTKIGPPYSSTRMAMGGPILSAGSLSRRQAFLGRSRPAPRPPPQSAHSIGQSSRREPI